MSFSDKCRRYAIIGVYQWITMIATAGVDKKAGQRKYPRPYLQVADEIPYPMRVAGISRTP